MIIIQQELLARGIGFMKNNSLIPFPIDNENPILAGVMYGFSRQSVPQFFLAWKQWRKFVTCMLSSKRGRIFFSTFLAKGSQTVWGDFERSEFTGYQNLEYFFDAHVTRIDLTLDASGNLKILDPNVMPYGITPLIASQEILGINSHLPYLETLSSTKGTWVADKTHGGAASIKWLTERAGIEFSYTEDFKKADYVIRQTRKNVFGQKKTINQVGIRMFESQLWSALMNIPNLGESFGFKVDMPLHRKNCTPTYLLKFEKEKILIAHSFQNNELAWISFDDFSSLFWDPSFSSVFLKSIFTSGCHQVTFSDFKENRIKKAIREKLGNGEFFLLQPAIPCSVDNERIRIASYVGANGQHYGTEVTRVPLSCMLAHGGEHAKISYLEI